MEFFSKQTSPPKEASHLAHAAPNSNTCIDRKKNGTKKYGTEQVVLDQYYAKINTKSAWINVNENYSQSNGIIILISGTFVKDLFNDIKNIPITNIS